ncbi:hypothetical protein VNO78_25903 [Psophocarpus tetragonolobus]|uniref:Cytochrome P450 n=1 Tax=Psophocarpus tetragonolobus TaxID=3891 RepID=A0AAN9SAL2_PSOTE
MSCCTFLSYSSGVSQKFRSVISCVLAEASKPNIPDYYPILRRLDPQGARRRMQKYYQMLIDVFDCIIEERVQRVDSIEGSDVLDSFLHITRKENSELTRHDVVHLFLDLFVAGLDTTSATVEWVITELLCNPEKLLKTKKELEQVLSQDEEPNDSDISKLTYLQAVVKETLRLHPTAPILVHKSMDDIDICGFKDFRVDDFGFIPFGSGRRMCPGVPLANRIVHSMLASMLYLFDWKVADDDEILALQERLAA